MVGTPVVATRASAQRFDADEYADRVERLIAQTR